MKRFWCLFSTITLGIFLLSYFMSSFIQDNLQKDDSRKALATVQRNLAAVPQKVSKEKKGYDLVPLPPSEYKKYGIVALDADQIPRNQSEYNFYVENSFEQNKFWDKEDSKTMLNDVKKNLDSQKFLENQKRLVSMAAELEAKLKENPPDKKDLEAKLNALYYGQAFRNAVGKKIGVGL